MCYLVLPIYHFGKYLRALEYQTIVKSYPGMSAQVDAHFPQSVVL